MINISVKINPAVCEVLVSCTARSVVAVESGSWWSRGRSDGFGLFCVYFGSWSEGVGLVWCLFLKVIWPCFLCLSLKVILWDLTVFWSLVLKVVWWDLAVFLVFICEGDLMWSGRVLVFLSEGDLVGSGRVLVFICESAGYQLKWRTKTFSTWSPLRAPPHRRVLLDGRLVRRSQW